MPVSCKMIDGKWRLCGPDGNPEKNAAGTALDGGGHGSEGECQKQASAVNASLEGRGWTDEQDPNLGFRAYSFMPGTFSEEERAVEGVAASENPVLEPDFARRAMVPTVLLMDGLVDTLPKKVPLTDTHRDDSIENILGSSMIRREGNKLISRRTFARDDGKSERAMKKVRDGHLTDSSIRYRVLDNSRVFVESGVTREIMGRSFTGPVAVVTKWTVQADSLCAVGRDQEAKMRSEASASPLETQKKEGKDMNEEMRKRLEALGLRAGATEAEALEFLSKLKPAVEQVKPVDEDKVRADAIAQERNRAAEIRQFCELAGKPELADKFVLSGEPADKVRAAVYADWQKARVETAKPTFAPAPSVEIGSRVAKMDTKEFTRSLCEMTPIEVDPHGISINQMRTVALTDPKGWSDKMRAAIEAKDLTLAKIQPHLKAIQTALWGVQVDEYIETPVGKRAIAASAFPVLCGNTIIAGIQAAYAETPGISDQLVEELDDNNALTRYAALRTWDSKEEAWREGEDLPLVGMGEEWVEGREKPMGRRIEILQTAIDRNQVNIVGYANALGRFAKNWVEKLTISRVCDQYGSAGSATEPYVYRPSGTGTTLYSASANTPGTRAPSGTSVASNALADYSDLDASRAVLVAMKDENGERISFSWNDIILLVPDAVYYIALRNLGSEYMPVPDTTFNSATLNHWGPRGAFRPRLLSSPKMDDISTSTWFMGNFKAQFMRKWARRFQYMTLGQDTPDMLKRGVAFQASMSWNCEVFAKDYVYVVRSTS